MSADGPHTVWWGLWKGSMGVIHYTKKHFTPDGLFTLCGRPVIIGGKVTFFPHTDDDPEAVTCRACHRILRNKGEVSL